MFHAVRSGIFDFDGVIFGPGHSRSPSGTKQFMELVADRLEEGIGCTGRDAGGFLLTCRLLGLRRGIAEHGAWFILDVDEEIITPSPLLENLRAGDRIPRQDFEHFLRELGGLVYPGKSVCLTAYPPKGMSPAQLRERIQEEWRGYPGTINVSDIAVDILPPGLDKGLALSEFPNLELQQCFGIGDSPGDIAWLNLLDWRVAAPENAAPAVKEFVGRKKGKVLDNPYILGACEAIEWFASVS